MSRFMNRGVQVVVDLTALSLAYWLAFLIRFEATVSLQMLKLLLFTWPYVMVLQYLALALFEVPRFSWRYVGLTEAKRIFAALAVASGVLVALRLGAAPLGGYAKFVTIPLGVLFIHFMLSVMGVAGVRVARRVQSEGQERKTRTKKSLVRPKRTLLLGAGRAGVMVAREVFRNPHVGLDVVGFIDDDPHKIGTIIQGHKVLGDTASLDKLVTEHRVEMAIITIAAAPGGAIRRIHAECERIGLPVKIIPGIYEILEGSVNLSRLREVTIEDLLGRDAVELDMEAIGAFLRGKRVLVTGAGGSIGSELCRQVARFAPSRLILAEQAENALFYIHKELLESEFGDRLELLPCIVDICDTKRVDQLFGRLKPQVVFHAAAHKHVPMMEWNPGEAVKNNVFGTKKVADAADRHGVAAFVMISTDKAVNPTSIMGASKRVAEIYVQSLARKSKTKFVAVRFGNVLGSAGSVIPIFKEQIRKGGPVTVTHPEMTRYFMTIPEACQLVMQAATMGKGGEIFVLDMGKPVKIIDLARDLIRLSGFSEEEIPIQFSGVRPGEKLYEEISTQAESMDKTRHPKIYIGRFEPYPEERARDALLLLEGITDAADPGDVRQALKQVVPEMLTPQTDPFPIEFIRRSAPLLETPPAAQA
jgi:FlaA1/EpsC-like NDP-sugar epimerase